MQRIEQIWLALYIRVCIDLTRICHKSKLYSSYINYALTVALVLISCSSNMLKSCIVQYIKSPHKPGKSCIHAVIIYCLEHIESCIFQCVCKIIRGIKVWETSIAHRIYARSIPWACKCCLQISNSVITIIKIGRDILYAFADIKSAIPCIIFLYLPFMHGDVTNKCNRDRITTLHFVFSSAQIIVFRITN